MKFKPLLFLVFAITLLLSNACQEDPIEKSGTTNPAPIVPDLDDKITTSVSGFVVDSNGQPVVFAEVTAGEKKILTDAFGHFTIANTSLAKIAGHVRVVKTGYFEGYKTFLPQEDNETFVRIQLLSQQEVGVIEAASGGSASTVDGGEVTLPANGVVNPATGTTYTGQVHVSARLINPAQEDDLGSTLPGDARGTDTDGHLQALQTFSMIAVELKTDAGTPLQIAEGKTATINLPIPPALTADAPSSIPLWSYDTESGLWKQEGTATKTGSSYEGEVSHFSFWSGAVGQPLVNFSAHIVNTSGEPLAHVPVSVTFAGMPKNAGHGRFGHTDADGNITGAVFANSELVLDIFTPCALSAYEYNFSTTSIDIDLGTLTGNLGQNLVTISGTARDCNNQPLTTGYVQTYDNGFYNRIPVVNGNFSFTGIACTNTTVSVVVVDPVSYEQSNPSSVDLTPGANNLGTLTACGTSTMGYITYQIDDLPEVTILEPTDTIAAFALPGGNTQIAVLSGDPNGAQQMSFQILGTHDTEAGHTLTDIYSTAFVNAGHGYWPVAIPVTITEYGNTGGFISGSFSSQIIDASQQTNTVHTITCSFRVRRHY